jgi:hypothetical protein
MARELKVFGITLMCSREEADALGMEAHARQVRAIVAATTKKEAVAKFGISQHEAAHFMTGPTGNSAEIAQAMTNPGQVFAYNGYGRVVTTGAPKYIEIERKPHAPMKRTKRPTYEEIMAARAKREAEKAKRKFSAEELEYMAEMFGSANNPLALAIAQKAKLILSDD